MGGDQQKKLLWGDLNVGGSKILGGVKNFPAKFTEVQKFVKNRLNLQKNLCVAGSLSMYHLLSNNIRKNGISPNAPNDLIRT